MSDVKWIKITTDIFDDEKILLIESLPDSYAIITVWFKLLCLAGKQNNSGVFVMGRIPYTDKMLATIFRMKETTVTMALRIFEEFGMVEIVNGVITIPNWGKHQNLDQLESKKEYMRSYMKEYRDKQKLLTTGKTNGKTNSKTNVSSADKEEDIDIDKDNKVVGVDRFGVDKDLAKIYRLWERAGGKCATNWENDQLIELLDSFGRERLERAIQTAAGNGRLVINYVRAVLENRGKKTPVNELKSERDADYEAWLAED